MRNPTIFVLLLSLIAAACATPTPPLGGPRDTSPPQLDTLRSTANEQVNFVLQPIELAFDEWIQLEDASNQILISPPLEFRPKVRIKKRSVIFEFDPREQLRANVTYAINFGTSVKDLTEKNVAENLRFVFSTGPKLDSLSIRGSIRDAVTGEPVEKALFMLYDNFADSVVRRERPLYFAKTDKEGRFEIRNIREGAFKGFALFEVNGNYRFDVPNEKIGFPDSAIAVSAEKGTDLSLVLFEESPGLRRTSIDTAFSGLVKVVFNQQPLRVRTRQSPPLVEVWQAIDRDTLFIWTNTSNAGESLILQRDNDYTDTLLLQAVNPAKSLPPLTIYPRPGERGQRQNPFEDFVLESSVPLGKVDTAGIVLQVDTLLERIFPSVFVDSVDSRRLRFQVAWRENIPYRLEVRPGAFEDIYGRSTDTAIVYSITPIPVKSFGNITLNVKGLDNTYAYVLELVVNSAVAFSRLLPAGETTRKVEFRGISPQGYSLRLVEDRNGNGQWDSGNYEQKAQPERIYLFKLEPMRANWDLEAEVVIER